MSRQITASVRGAHHGQMDCTLALRDGCHILGFVDYAVYQGQPAIQMIHVVPAHRRRRLASQMLAHLQSLYPDREIDWGSLTTAGAALKAAIPVRVEQTEHAPAFARLARLRGRLAGFETRIAALRAGHPEVRPLLTAFYELEARIGDLEYRLWGTTPTRQILMPDLTPVMAEAA